MQDAEVVHDLEQKGTEDSDIHGYQVDWALEISLIERTQENHSYILCANSQGMHSIGALETLISHSSWHWVILVYQIYHY